MIKIQSSAGHNLNEQLWSVFESTKLLLTTEICSSLIQRVSVWISESFIHNPKICSFVVLQVGVWISEAFSRDLDSLLLLKEFNAFNV